MIIRVKENKKEGKKYGVTLNNQEFIIIKNNENLIENDIIEAKVIKTIKDKRQKEVKVVIAKEKYFHTILGNKKYQKIILSSTPIEIKLGYNFKGRIFKKDENIYYIAQSSNKIINNNNNNIFYLEEGNGRKGKSFITVHTPYNTLIPIVYDYGAWGRKEGYLIDTPYDEVIYEYKIEDYRYLADAAARGLVKINTNNEIKDFPFISYDDYRRYCLDKFQIYNPGRGVHGEIIFSLYVHPNIEVKEISPYVKLYRGNLEIKDNTWAMIENYWPLYVIWIDLPCGYRGDSFYEIIGDFDRGIEYYRYESPQGSLGISKGVIIQADSYQIKQLKIKYFITGGVKGRPRNGVIDFKDFI